MEVGKTQDFPSRGQGIGTSQDQGQHFYECPSFVMSVVISPVTYWVQ